MSNSLSSLLIFKILALGLVRLALSAEFKSCNEEEISLLRKQCEAPKWIISNHNTFLEFYNRFDHLDSLCLRPNRERWWKTSELSRETEIACGKNGFHLNQMRPLVRLLVDWMNNRQVCTIQYTAKLHYLHTQLASYNNAHIYRQVLRVLANLVATKCRMTLVRRLAEVETEFPDSVTHINLILNHGGLSAEKVSQLMPIETIEQFVPILERELPRNLYEHDTSSLRQSAYEFKIVDATLVAYDKISMSCKAMKSFHVNLLGPIGLLASVGYSIPTVVSETLNPTRDIQESLIINRWLLSALLCQAIRTTQKIMSLSSEGTPFGRLRIDVIKEADVTSKDEDDSTFADLTLNESQDGSDKDQKLAWELIERMDESFKDYVLEQAKVQSINGQKIRMLSGPGRELSRAMFTFFKSNEVNHEKKLNSLRLITGLDFKLFDKEKEQGKVRKKQLVWSL